MANIEAAFNELADVVKHLASTHVHWNMDMSKAEAFAKIAVARTHVVAEDVVTTADDALTAVEDVSGGSLDVVVGDVQTVAHDVSKTVSDAKGQS